MLDILFFLGDGRKMNHAHCRKIAHESVVIKSIFVGVEGSDSVLLGKTKKVASIKGAPYKGCLDPGSPITGIGFVCNIEQRCFYMLLIT